MSASDLKSKFEDSIKEAAPVDNKISSRRGSIPEFKGAAAKDPNNPDHYGPYECGDAKNTLTLAAKITANDAARKWFSHGLAWMYGYNHEEAIGCYQKAIAADANCAMAWWGIAYSVSSSYNWPPGLGCGFDAITAASALVDKGVPLNDLEKDLIAALSTRSSAAARDAADPTKLSFGNLPELNQAFCDAMAKVYAKYPTDNDVAAVYAEGLMNLKPWALWSRETVNGELQITAVDSNTTDCMRVLETAFKNDRGDKHPALCHLYCHLLELSPFPEKALPYANTLRTLMPAMGHLVHMPSHIDAWVGGYKEGVKCNEDGVAADDRYVELSGNESQFYKFYRMHNMHFVVWMSMHDGRYANAMKYARKMQTQLDEAGVTFMLAGVIPMGAVFLEAFNIMPWHVMIRFGKWNDILAEPVPTNKDAYPGCIATAHYARGVAYAAQGKITDAKAEQAKFLEARNNPALAGRVLHNNPMWDPKGPSVLGVAEKVLAGEIAYREAVLGSTSPDAAFALLREGVVLSENLKYDEPWGWMVPIRHALGALLFESGRVEEATEVYRQDIKLWKDNMWGLHGLLACLKAAKGDHSEIKDVTAKYKTATMRADVKLTATCFCAKAAGAKGK